MTHDTGQINPWYKEPWPWLLMLGPTIVVIASICTYVIAQKTADPLVEDDYYKQGKEVNLQLKRDQNAYNRNISAQIMVSDNGKTVRVVLKNAPQDHDQLVLRLLHPTIAGHDQAVPLQKISASLYQATIQPDSAPHWYVRIEDHRQTWRIQGEWVPADGPSVSLDTMLPGTTDTK